MTLAGFDATPAEEIVSGPVEHVVQEGRSFDPGRDLLPDAVRGEGFLERLGEQFKEVGNWRT